MLVQAPDLPRMLCMKGTKYYGLYTYKNAWDAEKKRSYRVKGSTKCVGIMVSGDKTGKIKWSDEFLSEYPALESLISQRDEKGNITFSPLDEETQTITVKDALSAQRYHAGATWVLDHIIADTPLVKALNRTFGKYNLNKKILSLSYFLNLSEGNAMTRYENFAATHRLPWQHTLTSSAITRIFQNISSEQIDRFVAKLNLLSIDESKQDCRTKYWALDSTSISTYSTNLSKSSYGHNKDGDNLPQVNILMVVDQQTGEPVYYRTYNGNVPDIVTVKHLLQEHARIRLDSNAVFVADKGYGSVANIHRFYQNKTSFLINLKTSFSICRNIFDEARLDLFDPLNFNEDINNSCTTREITWSYPVNFKTDCKRAPRLKEKMYMHIYYDREIFNAHQRTITTNISKVAKMLQKGETLSPALKHIKDTFLIESVSSDGSITYSTNRKALDDYLKMKGVRILVSNEVKDPIEAYKAYFDRNEVEYAFRLFKQRLGFNRMRVSSNDSLEGKAFIQFIATSIAIMLRKRIANALKDNPKLKLAYDSEPVVLDKLDSIIETRFSFGSYYSEVVGGLKELFKALGIPEPSEELAQEAYEEDTEAEEKDLFEEKLEQEIQTPYQALE